MSTPLLKPLERLLGTWTTEATHPMMPGVVVHGTVTVEWLEGEKFLSHLSRTDHPDFPGSLSIIGDDAEDRAESDAAPALCMHYFDSRGVFRRYEVSADETAWHLVREAPGFSQRFTGTFAGDAIVGTWQLRKQDAWEDDLKITYRRATRVAGA